jgi:hypothetical protein
MLPWAGNSSEAIGSSEGYGVSSVASRETAAGLPVLTAMDGVARQSMPTPLRDRPPRVRRLLLEQLGASPMAPHGEARENTVPQQKHTEFRFEGAVASCYLRSSMGAEGGVADRSRN